MKKCLVLLSGGQDSAVCLAWALTHYDAVETLGFAYGQRHSVELDCRPKLREAIAAAFPAWASRLGPDHLLDLSVLGAISDTALTSTPRRKSRPICRKPARDVRRIRRTRTLLPLVQSIRGKFASERGVKGGELAAGCTSEAEIAFGENGLPNTFVPGRNLLFFTLAAALGYRRGLRDLVGGMCQTDYSGYPDCRHDTLSTLNHAINLGTDERFTIVTPLMWRTKAETWAMTHALGGDRLVEIVADHTHTCYKGDREHRHDWGYGCGACPACKLREKGYRAWRASVGVQA